ncbi:MAG TPA: DUF2784 domain-containing protein [Mucilaginibacter sp.]|nr:DUF2784 domain-containing protein [Mucilaginibacter sp.]
MLLHLADILLTLLHLVIIGFNLLGWIWKRTRRAHLVCVALTAGCWFILGIWFGWGYCPITDLEWNIKEKLGEHNLPNSFIKYYADRLSGTSVSASLVDTVTAVAFFMAALLSVYVNFFRRKTVRHNHI